MVLPNGDILKGDEQYTFKTQDKAKAYLKDNHLPSQANITYEEEEKQRLHLSYTLEMNYL